MSYPSPHRPRSICVPHDAASMKQLDLGIEDLTGITEWKLTEEEFQALMKTGILDALQMATGRLIGDFEEDAVLGSDLLEKGLACAKQMSSTPVIEKLQGLFETAILAKTGVYFFL